MKIFKMFAVFLAFILALMVPAVSYATSTAPPSAPGKSQGNGPHTPGNPKSEDTDKGSPHGANTTGPYDSTPSNGENQGKGKAPENGSVGNADDKNPPGQQPGGSDSNNGYECDGNKGVGDKGGNPAHTGCQSTRPTVSPTKSAEPTKSPRPTKSPEASKSPKPSNSPKPSKSPEASKSPRPSESPRNDKVTICHLTSSEKNPYVVITVDRSALDAHKAHGDIYPVPTNGCPKTKPTESPKPSHSPKPSDSPKPTVSPTPPVVCQMGPCVPTAKPTPTVKPTPTKKPPVVCPGVMGPHVPGDKCNPVKPKPTAKPTQPPVGPPICGVNCEPRITQQSATTTVDTLPVTGAGKVVGYVFGGLLLLIMGAFLLGLTRRK